jgi:hypothetical protein
MALRARLTAGEPGGVGLMGHEARDEVFQLGTRPEEAPDEPEDVSVELAYAPNYRAGPIGVWELTD